jgi:predicted aspartyl protease
MARFPLKFHGAHIVVRVVVEDKRRAIARLILDIGAEVTMISPQLAERAGINWKRARKHALMSGVTGTTIIPLVRIQRLIALGKTQRNLRVICANLPPPIQVDGLLGLDFLSQYNVHLNFLDGYLEILEKGEASSLLNRVRPV